MFKFRNIDNFTPGRFERMGMLKGKRWYTDTEISADGFGSASALFKPKRKEFGDKKVFCANHYGELVGYLLAIGSRTQSCKTELAHLSRYYENIHKERNNGTPVEADGCIIYSHLDKNQILEHGKIVIDAMVSDNYDLYIDRKSDFSNEIEVCMAAIETATRKFYQKSAIRRSQEYIDSKVQENREKAVNMMIYDCLYGNNDRHDENWALVKDAEGRDISLYPLYDNERVLGLYENIRTITYALNNDSVEQESERILFSRMKVPGEKEKSSSYKDVLKYLLDTYPEAQEILDRHLKGNTPRNVKMYLESCENLPREYIDFGSKMYESRYEFAKNLLLTRGTKNTKYEKLVKLDNKNAEELELA